MLPLQKVIKVIKCELKEYDIVIILVSKPNEMKVMCCMLHTDPALLDYVFF